jgi:spore coat polysaccharide biosynthesis protein SpsF
VNRQKREELVKVALLIPKGDPIGKDFDRVPVFEGDENDVLSRYAGAAEEFRASHLVRVTGDCPLLRPFVISKAISLGVQANYSYLSNVDERCRTSPDGQDVEFMSRDMLDWLNRTASTAFHREHVTTFAREDPPRWAKRGFIIDHFDYSTGEKISVDTQEDLETVRRVYSDIAEKYQKACSLYPKHCIHRL